MRPLLHLLLPLALITVAGVALPAEAEQQLQLNPAAGVSSAVIRSEGYELTLANGTVVNITGVSTQQTQDCMVHLPSVRRAIQAGLRSGALEPIGTAAQQINLQVLQDPNTGEIWCAGAGSGCAIIVE